MTSKYHNSNLNVNALASPSRSRWLVLHSLTFNLSEFGSFLPLVLWTSPKNFTFLAHGFQGFLDSPSLEPLAIGWSPEACMAVVILLSFFFCEIFAPPFCHLSILTHPLVFQVFDHSNPLTFVSMHSQPYFVSPNSLVSSEYPWKFLKVNSWHLPHKFKLTPSQLLKGSPASCIWSPPSICPNYTLHYLAGLTPSPIYSPILYVRILLHLRLPLHYICMLVSVNIPTINYLQMPNAIACARKALQYVHYIIKCAQTCLRP